MGRGRRTWGGGGWRKMQPEPETRNPSPQIFGNPQMFFAPRSQASEGQIFRSLDDVRPLGLQGLGFSGSLRLFRYGPPWKLSRNNSKSLL